MKLVLDAMGGDKGIKPIVSATVEALNSLPNIESMTLVGDESTIHSCLDDPLLIDKYSNFTGLQKRLNVLHAPLFVGMEDSPAQVLKERADTSMCLSLKALFEEKYDACISGGNTGALVGLSRHLLGMLEGVKKIAVCAQLPTLKRSTYLLDVGANVDCSAKQLYKFAKMGSAIVESIEKIKSPSLSSLSIGSEQSKGNKQVKEAVDYCISDQNLNYVGMCEGSDLLKGDSDVIFCDGFVGNIALKASEGTARHIRKLMLEQSQSDSEKSNAFVNDFAELIDPAQFNGAYLLGLDQLVIKSHGDSDTKGIYAAIKHAAEAVDGRVIEHLKEYF